MNRKPRTDDELYKWHRETLEHIANNGEADRKRPRVSENEPQPGWFMRRLVQKGPYVPCRIWVEPGDLDDRGNMVSPEKWFCEVDGQRRDVAREWTWLCGHPISEDKYMDMLAGTFAQPREVSHLDHVTANAQIHESVGNKGPEIITDNIPPRPAGGPKTDF